MFGIDMPEIGSALGKGIKNFKKSANKNNEIANPATKKNLRINLSFKNSVLGG